jgi:cyclic di-GMP phosphodiesterase
MTWDPRPAGRSPEADRPAAPAPPSRLAEVVRDRGAILLDALERHRPGSRDHADGAAIYAFAAAVELGRGRDFAEAVREAARLHEIGMPYVAAATLAKAPDELTPEDRRALDSRFASGADLARGAGVPEVVCEWIRAAGEHFDGSGQMGWAGQRIPLESRIIRAACVCATIVAAPAPTGASALGRHELAVEGLRRPASRELDPRVAAGLAALLERAALGAGRP